MIHYVKGNLLESQVIINFPTKTDWRRPSEYSYIEQGLHVLYHLNGSYIKAKLESFMVDDMKYCGLL
ncbi:MAG: hypothetical protein J5720_01070, partial [Bacteroidaceae bacterium]|nr:hypothetical protein [Bacteroidaceae bacterium]